MSWKIHVLLSIFHILISFFPVGTENALFFVGQNFKYRIQFFTNALRFFRLGREKFKFNAQNFKERLLFYVNYNSMFKIYKRFVGFFNAEDENFKK